MKKIICISAVAMLLSGSAFAEIDVERWYDVHYVISNGCDFHEEKSGADTVSHYLSLGFLINGTSSPHGYFHSLADIYYYHGRDESGACKLLSVSGSEVSAVESLIVNISQDHLQGLDITRFDISDVAWTTLGGGIIKGKTFSAGVLTLIINYPNKTPSKDYVGIGNERIEIEY